MAQKAPVVRITGTAEDIIVVRSTGKVTIVNGVDLDEDEELPEIAKRVVTGDRAQRVIETDSVVEIGGEVSDVVIVEGEAVIYNALSDEDED